MPIAVPEVSDKTLKDLVSLKRRHAVVTGGGRGLGEAIVTRLAEAGSHILIADLDEESALKAAADISNNYGVTAIGMRLDVTDASSVAAVADAANARLGGIDIWVNNTGIFPSVPLLDMTDAVWDSSR